MATVQDNYLILGEETVYGTAIAPTRPIEYRTETFKGNYERIESQAQRAGVRVLRSDRFQPNPKGANGSVTAELVDAGMGFLWKHMLGTIASGTPTGGFTVHTATVGALAGRSLTAQAGRTDSSGVTQVFTYEGGKVSEWEVSAEIDGVALLAATLDFEAETIGAGAGAYAAAVPTYPVAGQLLTYIGGTVTIGGTALPATAFSVTGNNNLKTDRWGMRGANTALKREPLEQGQRDYGWSCTIEFDGLTQINRVASLTAAGAIATGAFHLESPGGGMIDITVPVLRVDTDIPTNSDMNIRQLDLGGKILWDGTASPLTVAAKTRDAAP